jgi:hypothetical protein
MNAERIIHKWAFGRRASTACGKAVTHAMRCRDDWRSVTCKACRNVARLPDTTKEAAP